jgi:hypothetical protein
VFKNAWFARFAQKQRIPDKALLDAIERAEKGQINADLGGGVLKQRVARKGQGKTGGFRTIILYRAAERAFFVYAFAKSDVTISTTMKKFSSRRRRPMFLD